AAAAIQVMAGGLEAISPVASRWHSQRPLCTASSTYAPTRRSLSSRFGWPASAMANRTMAVAPRKKPSHHGWGGVDSAMESGGIGLLISRVGQKPVNANSGIARAVLFTCAPGSAKSSTDAGHRLTLPADFRGVDVELVRLDRRIFWWQ